MSDKIKELLEYIIVDTANDYGGFEGFDKSDRKRINETAHQLNQMLIEARISEVEGFNTRRHYGKDYQGSLDELDEYKNNRLAALKAEKEEL